MNQEEQIQHEAIKAMLKQTVMNNTNLTSIQKEVAINNIDRAAQQADWIEEMLRMCGYIK